MYRFLSIYLFSGNRILGKLKVDQGVTFIRSQRDSSLVALAFEDFSIGLIDFTSRKLARRLSGHSGHITDLTFSPDCRWIISASADSSIRVWDLPTASLIDMFKVLYFFVKLIINHIRL